jgi:1,4-dihydroxy-2-naphthoate octaprenyltransferase
MRPAFAVGIGEGLVVVVEGILIYLICRFVPSAKSDLVSPSIFKCLLASLIGNIVSASAFPILLAIYDRFPSI